MQSIQRVVIVVAFAVGNVVFSIGNVRAEQIHVEFTVEASTVVGTPFGFGVDDIRGRIFPGTFFYDTLTPGTPVIADTMDYKHATGTGGFSVDIDGLVIAGSAPVYRIENRDAIDEFEFADGNKTLILSTFVGGIMTVGGAPDENVGVALNISDGSNPFPDSSLPNPFPYDTSVAAVPPHTFPLDDDNEGGGGILFQFKTLAPVDPVPEPSAIVMAAMGLLTLVLLGRRFGRR